MATPLSELLHGLRSDDGVRADFLRSPSEFMSAHGWSDLDPADLQEACYILADAAPAADASAWLTAGAAVDPEHDGSAADGLVAAIGAIAGDSIVTDADPHDLDALDDTTNDTTNDTDDDTDDDIDVPDHDLDADGVDQDDLDDLDDLDDTGRAGGAGSDQALVPEPHVDVALDHQGDGGTIETGDLVDDLATHGWDDAAQVALDDVIEPVDDVDRAGFAEPTGGAPGDLTDPGPDGTDEWDDLI